MLCRGVGNSASHAPRLPTPSPSIFFLPQTPKLQAEAAIHCIGSRTFDIALTFDSGREGFPIPKDYKTAGREGSCAVQDGTHVYVLNS